ncbi:MAG: hypothetical protein AVDCRST_MAG35-1946, partial [uncultured Quadrisphaera sp.]
ELTHAPRDRRQHQGPPAQPLPVQLDRLGVRRPGHLDPPARPRPGRLGGGAGDRRRRRGQPAGRAAQHRDRLLRRPAPGADVRGDQAGRV